MSLLRASALASSHAAASTKASSVGCALEAASVLLPHPLKADTGGEDAVFCGEAMYGVFDGVGGWSSRGVDAGAFSRQLAQRTHAHLMQSPDEKLDVCLGNGLREVKVLGSCTACLLRIDRSEGVLSALNLGDSGWRLFRPDAENKNSLRVAIARESQQHYFNCPLQLGGGSTDKPSDGDALSTEVLPGDFVLMATDGVLDNLFDEEIAEILAKAAYEGIDSLKGGSEPAAEVIAPSAAELAELIALYARHASLQQTRRTPFAVGAAQAGYQMPGGKVDDVTVVCIKVLPAGSAESVSERTLKVEKPPPRSRL